MPVRHRSSPRNWGCGPRRVVRRPFSAAVPSADQDVEAGGVTERQLGHVDDDLFGPAGPGGRRVQGTAQHRGAVDVRLTTDVHGQALAILVLPPPVRVFGPPVQGGGC